jgi:shikimate dehydrogenase
MTEITGRTRLYAIVADPVGHVRTPMVFNARFAAKGTDAVLVPLHVPPAGLPDLFRAARAMKNLGGLIVTVPHKSAAVALCDEVSDMARAIGAVNTIRREPDGRLLGEMFDGPGFLAGLRQEGIEPRGRSVLLSGAGGAANAIAFVLAQAGVARLTIANRTSARAEELAARVRRYAPTVEISAGPPDPTGHELVVNATSLGLKEEDALPLDVDRLTPGMIVAEIIMIPEQTKLLREAARRGCRVHLGRHMLDTQVELMARFIGA